MRLGELKLSLAEIHDDDADIKIDIYVNGVKIVADPGEIGLLYIAHPTEPGRGQLHIYTAPTSWPPEVE